MALRRQKYSNLSEKSPAPQSIPTRTSSRLLSTSEAVVVHGDNCLLKTTEYHFTAPLKRKAQVSLYDAVEIVRTVGLSNATYDLQNVASRFGQPWRIIELLRIQSKQVEDQVRTFGKNCCSSYPKKVEIKHTLGHQCQQAQFQKKQVLEGDTFQLRGDQKKVITGAGTGQQLQKKKADIRRKKPCCRKELSLYSPSAKIPEVFDEDKENIPTTATTSTEKHISEISTVECVDCNPVPSPTLYFSTPKSKKNPGRQFRRNFATVAPTHEASCKVSGRTGKILPNLEQEQQTPQSGQPQDEIPGRGYSDFEDTSPIPYPTELKQKRLILTPIQSDQDIQVNQSPPPFGFDSCLLSNSLADKLLEQLGDGNNLSLSSSYDNHDIHNISDFGPEYMPVAKLLRFA